jgi:hypothetical protein
MRNAMTSRPELRPRGEINGASCVTAEMALDIASKRMGQRAFAKHYGIGRTTVKDIQTGNTWGHVTGIERPVIIETAPDEEKVALALIEQGWCDVEPGSTEFYELVVALGCNLTNPKYARPTGEAGVLEDLITYSEKLGTINELVFLRHLVRKDLEGIRFFFPDAPTPPRDQGGSEATKQPSADGGGE